MNIWSLSTISLKKKIPTNSENFFIAAVLMCFQKWILFFSCRQGSCTQLTLHCLKKKKKPSPQRHEIVSENADAVVCYSGLWCTFNSGVSFGRPETLANIYLPWCYQFARLIKLVILVNNKIQNFLVLTTSQCRYTE